MVDVSGGVDAITGAMTSIASIAVAVLALLVIPKLFRWMREVAGDVGIIDQWVNCPVCDYEIPMDHDGTVCPACGHDLADDSMFISEDGALDECEGCGDSFSWDVWDASGGVCPSCGQAHGVDE